MSQPGDLEVREAHEDDRPAVLELLAASLRWVPDELFDRFFEWKHRESPFGHSPAWVAVAGSRVVGFRTFMRWEFAHPDGKPRRAVRAVDTATHPDFQGRGIFTLLTRHALESLAADGVDFVFNTPNDQSRPGYLKMGWSDVGRLPTCVRPAGPRALVRMLRARVPADRWSLPVTSGLPPAEVFADARTATLVEGGAAPRGLRTRRSLAYLRWRYGFGPLGYRVVTVSSDPAEGVAVFRVRRRGGATEAAVCEILAPSGARNVAPRLLRAVGRASGADYAIRIGGPLLDRSGFARLPGQGPMLTWRGLEAGTLAPALADWSLALGDVELF